MKIWYRAQYHLYPVHKKELKKELERIAQEDPLILFELWAEFVLHDPKLKRRVESIRLERQEQCTYLTYEEVKRIERLLTAGFTQQEIKEMTHVGLSTIKDIKYNRHRLQHVHESGGI